MSKLIHVLVLDLNTNSYTYLFEFPYDETGVNTYRANTSIGAFFFGPKSQSETSNYMFCWGNSAFGSSIPATTNLKSVWDFYNVIGYDHKTKKYIRDKILLPPI